MVEVKRACSRFWSGRVSAPCGTAAPRSSISAGSMVLQSRQCCLHGSRVAQRQLLVHFTGGCDRSVTHRNTEVGTCWILPSNAGPNPGGKSFGRPLENLSQVC